MSVEIISVFLLDSNLQILFSQERQNLSHKFHELRQLISDSLHGNRSHIVKLGVILISSHTL